MSKIIILAFAFLLTQNLIHSQDIAKNKKNSRLAYNAAVENIKSSNFDVALTYIDASLDLDPGFTDALMLKAKVETELGMLAKALKDFELVTQKDDKRGEAYFYIGYLQFKADTGSVIIKNLNLAIQKGYKTPQSYFYRGLYKLIAKEYSEAIKDFTEAVGLQSDFALAFHDRATAKYRLGDLQGAMQDYRTATNFNHDFSTAFVNMGIIKTELGDYPGAIEDYSIAISLDSTIFTAYNNRGNVKYFLGDIPGALVDFNKAIILAEKKYVNALNNKGCALAKNGELKDAILIFDDIIVSDVVNAKAHLNRGLVKELLGDIEGACADWKIALENGISDAENYLKECK